MAIQTTSDYRCKPDHQPKDVTPPDVPPTDPFDPVFEDPFPPDTVGKIPARCCVGKKRSCKVTSKLTGWSVTVRRGGIGDDNVFGSVEDGTGAAAGGVRVEINNQDSGETETATTGFGGDYDEDVDASKGDVVVVTVRKKKGGKIQVIAVCKLN